MFFKKPVAPMSKPVVPAPKPVMPLPKLTTPHASELASKFKPQPEAQALLKPGQSSSEYIHALESNQQSTDAINALAHGMPERESVGWACQSSEMVADKLDQADKSALQAAQGWVSAPTEANQAAAAAAAAKTNHQGPGAWAAQGAAWSQPTVGSAGPVLPGAPPGTPSPTGLTGHAVAGSVMLAAAMAAGKMPPARVPGVSSPQIAQAAVPSVPALGRPAPLSMADRAEMANIHQPFIDLGKSIASGQTSVA